MDSERHLISPVPGELNDVATGVAVELVASLVLSEGGETASGGVVIASTSLVKFKRKACHFLVGGI